MKKVFAVIVFAVVSLGFSYAQEVMEAPADTVEVVQVLPSVQEEMPVIPVSRPKNEMSYSLSYATLTQAQYLAGGVVASFILALFGASVPAMFFTPGAFGVEYNHYLTNVIGVGGGVSLDYAYSPLVGGGLYASVLPDVKFRWLYRNKLRLYSKIGAGCTVGFPFSSYSEGYHVESRFAWQVTPIGFEFNTRHERWKLFFDLGLGTQGLVSFGIRNTF